MTYNSYIKRPGLPWCPVKFFFVLSLLCSFSLLFWLLCSTSLVNATVSYTEDEPKVHSCVTTREISSVFIVLHHLHHVTTETLQYIRAIIIPNNRTLHNHKKRKMCAVTKVAEALELVTATYNITVWILIFNVNTEGCACGNTLRYRICSAWFYCILIHLGVLDDLIGPLSVRKFDFGYPSSTYFWLVCIIEKENLVSHCTSSGKS